MTLFEAFNGQDAIVGLVEAAFIFDLEYPEELPFTFQFTERTTQENCGEVQMEQVENILPLETDDEMQEPQFPLKETRVLSLFDGLSVGRFSLKQLKIAVGAYFSSEVDENALKLSKYNLGDEVQQIGCVTKVTSDVLRSLGGIDLLLAAPPCQDFSSANPDRKGFAGIWFANI
ncbi:DNA (cytosine-5)-methyltransferase 3B-like [Frankliniella occidentalis]|uniref:DNA (cytosine-5-)-methyltransferase n=1 Tax=Frankliniella occidentalis TaxID=133901 RepID=A0A9C6X5M5_FRAOC|nr:DNA (cytosine-5)-methyltransferase 3B-like [Frankliniella occidentalis]